MHGLKNHDSQHFCCMVLSVVYINGIKCVPLKWFMRVQGCRTVHCAVLLHSPAHQVCVSAFPFRSVE